MEDTSSETKEVQHTDLQKNHILYGIFLLVLVLAHYYF
jgi:hypothetical protein